MNKNNSGVGVLDKAVTILGTLESGPHSLAELVAAKAGAGRAEAQHLELEAPATEAMNKLTAELAAV